jgi:addiction module RelE/StbE family toxin
MIVQFSSSFKRAYKKRLKKQPDLEVLFRQRLTLYVENCFHPRLKTHKLSGRLETYWSFSLAYDLRVIFQFISDDEVIFLDIGTHDEVY